jgi:biopolymer transport protein ExbD
MINGKVMVSKHAAPEVSTSSMADIAFLLLTFFLITTIIPNDRGLTLLLPPFLKTPQSVPVHERNLFTVLINSSDELLIEGERRSSISGLRDEIKIFVLNNGRDNKLSDNPQKAVISIKTDRGTSYKMYVTALDEVQAAYYEIYSARAGISSTAFRKLNTGDAKQKKIYDEAMRGIPMNISIAESSRAIQASGESSN